MFGAKGEVYALFATAKIGNVCIIAIATLRFCRAKWDKSWKLSDK
jgi:hypothetical protein